MAILTSFKMVGDPDQLLRMKKEHIDPTIQEIAPQNGALAHIVVKADDGLVVYNLWESLEGSERTAQEVRSRLEGSGQPLPERTEFQQHEVLQHALPGAKP